MHFQTAARRQKHLGRITGVTLFFLLLVGVALPVSSSAAKRSGPPVTVILAHPARVSHSPKATFVFYSNYWDVDSYRCSLDRSAYRSYAPMKTYYGLKTGKHRFAVKAVNDTNAGPAVGFSWVIKVARKRAAAPTVAINTHPSLNTVSTSATFSFAANKSKASFICAIDRQAQTADTSYSYCESPVTYTDLAPGYHSFTVIAAAGGRNSRPQTYSWNIAAVAPVNTAAPVITGTVQVGKTLTASNGSWTGSLPISYTYQWQFCSGGADIVPLTTDTSQLISCGDIFGATSSSYTVQDASTLFYYDSLGLSAKTMRGTGANYTLCVVVTATNAAGQAKAVSSNVLSAAPVNTALPTIYIYVSGSEAYVDDYGDWLSFDPAYEWSYQWLRCDKNGDSCSAISGATSYNYYFQAPDVGNTLRLVLTATNNGGQGSATTLPTAVIEEAVGQRPRAFTLQAIESPVFAGLSLSAEQDRAASGAGRLLEISLIDEGFINRARQTKAMEFELQWLRPSLLICRVSGVVTVGGCEALMRAVVSEPQFRSGIGVITDETDVDVSALTADDIEQIANLTVQFEDTAAVRSAVVAGPDSPNRYGLARMFGAYADSQKNTTFAVFGTLDEAVAWLSETDVPSYSEPPGDGPQAPPEVDR